MLYHYFGSKRALYIACLRRSIDEFLGSIEDPGSELPLDHRLRHAIDSYLGFVVEHPASYAAVLRGGIGMDDEVHALVEEARERFFRLIVGGLGIANPTPELGLAVWGWMGFVEATCIRWLKTADVDRRQVRDLLADAALAVLGRGLAG